MNLTNTPAQTSIWRAIRGFSPDLRKFLLFATFSGIVSGAIILDFNLYASSLGYSNITIGYLNAIRSFATFFIGLPSGFLADRFGYRPFLFFAIVSMFLAPFTLILFPAQISCILYIILFSMGSSLLWVISLPILAGLSAQNERVHTFSANAFITTASFAVGNLVGGYAPELQARMFNGNPNDPAALRTTFFVAAFINLIMFFIALSVHIPRNTFTRAENTADAAAAQQNTFWRKQSLLIKFIIPSALIGLGAGAFITFQQLYFHQRFHLDPGPIANILAISQVLTAVAILAAPWLSKHVGKVNASLITEYISIPFLLTLGFTYNFTEALTAFYIRGALMNMNSPITDALAMDLLPANQRGKFTSIQNAMGNLGRGGLGPAISGWLQALGGYGAAFSFTAITYFIAATLYFRFFHGVESETTLFGWFAKRKTAHARQ